MNRCHLNYSDRINLGAFYTPSEYVKIAWNLIRPFLTKDSVVLDSSCGYEFFINNIKQTLPQLLDFPTNLNFLAIFYKRVFCKELSYFPNILIIF